MMAASNTSTDICKKHGPYQAKILTVFDRTISTGCPTCVTERDEQHAARERMMQADSERRRIESLYQRAGIPARFKARTFDNFEVTTDGQASALRKARAYADGWKQSLENGTCLIFSGNAGTGKTHLACAIANALMDKGVSSLFTTVSDAMRAIKRSYDAGSNMSEQQAIDAFVAPQLLILDEIGAARGTEYEMQMLFDIINKRYEQVRPTIILTNLDAEALKQHLGERIVDRLREGGGKLVPFTWDSHRS